jgi:hypothetical protein
MKRRIFLRDYKLPAIREIRRLLDEDETGYEAYYARLRWVVKAIKEIHSYRQRHELYAATWDEVNL